MKNNKFVEIKNRITYIHTLVAELEDIIKEAELTEALNTSNKGSKPLNGIDFLAGSVVNELDGYEEMAECKNHCFVKYFAGMIAILTIVYLLAQ